MTNGTSSSPANGPRYTALSPEDLAALRRSSRELNDLDPHTKARAQAGFRNAYRTAQRVVDGRIDPMSV